MTRPGEDAARLRELPHLYDTMRREVLPLRPLAQDVFRFYCCGPTVYGPAHIGNFRTFVLQDVFRRVLESCGIPTRHVRNITDVDDKTIRQSRLEGLRLGDFTQVWASKFQSDCAALNLLPPHVEPSAVEHIPEQIELIRILVEKGFAYVAPDGSVYFRIRSFPGYGKLSRLEERTITTNAPGFAESADEYERESAADFALWKARRPEDGENFWPSPWGEGRPGWHIECSAMSMKHLGETFDLHGGGVDLVFPHHENEIAQSEAATGKKFATHWFHIAHLLVDGRKMSKSLGNLFTLEDVRKQGFTAEELRYVLLSGSYRQPLNFTWDSLRAARSALGRLRQFGVQLGLTDEDFSRASAGDFGPFVPVLKAAAADLNTPEALGVLFSLLREFSEGTLHCSSEDWKRGFLSVLFLFGFRLPAPVAEIAPPEILQLAEMRQQARTSKDWALADTLRQQLADAGWTVKDSSEGYSLTKIPVGR